MLAQEWGVGQVLWSVIWITLFFIWIWLLISVFADIFRSHDLSGWGKAAWSIFIIFLPYLGVFVYLIARGGKMAQHAREAEAAQRQYIRDVAGTSAASPAEELHRLADLKERGVIDEAEFQRLKARVLG
jgi:hypothetical protein